MALIWADCITDTTTGTGTGPLTVSGTPSFQNGRTFSAVCSAGDTFYGRIASQSATEWEEGLYTYSSANTITRTTVLKSSNSDSAVSFSAGTKDVSLVLLASVVATLVAGGGGGGTPGGSNGQIQYNNAGSFGGVSVVTGANGGTGVANTGKTITLGGNLTTSGAYSLTVALGANSSVNVPASGNLLSDAVSANLTVGYTVTPYSAGTKSSGTFTPDPTLGQQQYITAGGAFTLAPQSTASQIMIEVLNNGSAGAITTSGFTKVTGDTYATTNTNKYLFIATKTQNYSHLNIIALQ